MLRSPSGSELHKPKAISPSGHTFFTRQPATVVLQRRCFLSRWKAQPRKGQCNKGRTRRRDGKMFSSEPQGQLLRSCMRVECVGRPFVRSVSATVWGYAVYPCVWRKTVHRRDCMQSDCAACIFAHVRFVSDSLVLRLKSRQSHVLSRKAKIEVCAVRFF